MRLLARSSKTLVVASILATHAACTGGASGGGTGPEGGGLTLDRTTADFSAVVGSSPAFAEEVIATIDNAAAAYVAAGFPPEQGDPGWLIVELFGAGPDWTLRLSVNATALPPGTHVTTVRVVIADAREVILDYHDVTVTYVVSPILTVAPAGLAFDHIVGGATETASVSIGGTLGVAWTAAASEGWVTLGATSGTTPASVVVGFDGAGLGVGFHTATVTFSAGEVRRTVTVSLDVTPAALVHPATLAFAGVNGATLGPKTLALSMNNGTAVSWTATPSESWLVLGRSTGTTPDSVEVRVDPSVGDLAAGSHSAQLAITADAGGSPLSATVSVTVTLTKAAFTVAPTALALGGANGLDLSARSIQLTLGTPDHAYAWSATPSSAWLGLSATSGTVSTTPVTIDVVPDRTGLQGGTRTGSIDFSVTVNGDTITATVPVAFDLEAHTLLVSAEGVALSTVPGAERLTRTLAVDDNWDAGTPWTAASDQEWLTVTSSGTGDGELALSANPAGLATDALHYANVTIASSDPTVEGTETVRVGLWVGSTASVTTELSGSFREIETDPVRPYAYVHSGGSTVTVYQVHTGAVVSTITGVGTGLEGMAVSGDGSTLFAIDRPGAMIVPVDLDSGTVGTGWPLSSSTAYRRLRWTRSDGARLLVVNDGTVRGAGDGTTLATYSLFPFTTGHVAVSQDGGVFCASNCKSLAHTALDGGAILVGSLKGAVGDYDGGVSRDGSLVYWANGGSPRAYSTATGTQVQTLAMGTLSAHNIEVDLDGRVFAGAFQAAAGADDVRVFDGNGTALGSFRLVASSESAVAATMRLSGDGLRAVGLARTTANAGRLAFATIPTFP